MGAVLRQRESDGLVRHGSILLVATVVAGLVNFLFHLYMIRVLSPEDYGVLFSLLAVFMIVSVPSGTIHTVVAKYVSDFKARDQYGKIAFLFFQSTRRVLLCAVVGLVGFTLASGHISAFLKIPSRIPVMIVGFALAISFLIPVCSGVLLGLQRFNFLGFGLILAPLLRILLGILFVWLGLGVNGALGSSLLAGLILFLIMFVPLGRLFRRQDHDAVIESKQIYRFSVPTLHALLFYALLTYIDVPLIKHYLSPLTAGYYSTVALVGKAFLFPPTALAAAMFPKVSELIAQGRDARPLLHKALFLSICVLVFGMLICFLFPEFLLAVLTKKQQLTTAEVSSSTLLPLLRTFGAAMSPFALSYVLIYYNLACNRTRFVYVLIVATVLEVILIAIFHATLLQVILVMGLCGLSICVVLWCMIVRSERNRAETAGEPGRRARPAADRSSRGIE